jgi:hypothetical protein
MTLRQSKEKDHGVNTVASCCHRVVEWYYLNPDSGTSLIYDNDSVSYILHLVNKGYDNIFLRILPQYLRNTYILHNICIVCK